MITAAVVATPLAASADPLPVDALVREVLERNRSVRANVLRRDAFGDEARAAGIYPDPQIAVMVDRVPRAHADSEMPMVRYQATQMFPWPGKLPLVRAAVEGQRDASGADLDVRRLDLRLEAKRAYYMLALNEKRREVNRANRNLAATIAQAALGRYSTGLGGHHDVVRAQVEVNALDVERINLDGERSVAIAMINALRDRPIEEPTGEPVLAPSPREEPLASLVEHANAQRPELRGMRAMQSEATAMADLARRERYPDIMGSVWMNQNIGAPASAGGMVGVTLPVFGIARQGYRARAFDARAEGAVADAAAMRAMIRFEVAAALVRVQTVARRVELIETVVLPKARASFEASLAGYGASTLDVLSLLDARRSLQSASLALAEAQVEREIALAELERAVGAPIGGAR